MSEIKPVILFVIDTLQTGGAEKSLLEICRRLTSFRPVICTVYSKNADLLPEFRISGIDVVSLNVVSSIWWYEGAGKLRKIIQSVKPSIIHSMLFRAEIISRITLWNDRMPHIGSFVNDSYARERYQQQTFVQNLKLDFYRLIDRITASRVPWFTSITKAIAQTNAKALSVDHGKIKVIYRGRSLNLFPPSADSYDPSRPFVFITVARLLKRKGHAELVRAVEILKEKGYSFRHLIVGEGHDRAFIENEVKRLDLSNYIILLGNRQDVPLLLQDSQCFVFPSHYEGQGGALVEAMLAGKPIIATRIPVIQEQIQENETGILFSLFDEKDLAEKMEWMMNNYSRAKTYGQNARIIATQRFNIEQIVKECEDFYNHILNA